MLRYERIRRFVYLRNLIIKWTNEEDVQLLTRLLKETNGQGDVIERINWEMFNDIYAIDLIRHYLNIDSTESIDNEWLSQEEIEKCDENAVSIYKQRLDSEEWGIF